MADTGQDIVIRDTMSLAELIALEEDTDKRFTFTVDPSGLFATVLYVNFYKVGGNRQKDTKTQAWKLLEHQCKKVVLQ